MKKHRTSTRAMARAARADRGQEASVIDTEMPAGVTRTATPVLDAAAQETGGVDGAVEAALTAIASGHPIPEASVATLVAEITRARETGRLGVLRDKVSVAVTRKPALEEGAAVLERCREEAKAGAPEGEKPGPLDDAYHRGFKTLYEAVRDAGSSTDQTTWALLVAGSDTLFTCAEGAVGLDDIPTFSWVGAHKLVADVSKASKRLGEDLWCTYLHGVHGTELLQERLYGAIPAHLRPEALDRILANPKLLEKLKTAPKVLDIAIQDLYLADPNYVVLATEVARRDARKLPADGLAVWAGSVTKAAVERFETKAENNLLDALVARPVRHSQGLMAWMDDEMTAETDRTRVLKLFKARFALDIENMRTGDTPGAATDTGVLRRMWTVLAALPSQHVSENEALETIRRNQVRDVPVGGHSSSTGTVYLSYPDSGATTTKLGQVPNMGVTPSMRPVDALSHVLRHEVGHAVDTDNNIMGSRSGDAAFGGWESLGNDVEAAGALTDEAGVKTQVKEAELATAISAGDASAVAKLGGGEDPVATGAAKAMEEPGRAWVGEPEGVVGEHVYVRFSSGSWQRYDLEARDRKVSNYQFKSPGEWFAEAYAAHYAGQLSGRDATMATWLTNTVGSLGDND